MSIHLYFSLIPEALIASMLTPEQFGQYYATGFKFKSKGQALFFEVDPAFRHPYFDIDGCYKRCKPKADGSPKNSVYISMYRVLEHLSVAAIGKLYMTTAMGATLGIERGAAMPPIRRELHMYQTPVSYTHLDVYKRQCWRCPKPRCRCSCWCGCSRCA